MITKKTIYVTEDGMQFENENDAIEYDRDEMVISAMSKLNLGDPLPVPKIGEGYCLETIQHTQGGLYQLVELILFIVKNHMSMYVMAESDFQNMYDNIKASLKDLSANRTTCDLNRDFYHIMKNVGYLILRYYQFPDKYFDEHLAQSTICKVVHRLKNTSYITGKEYYDGEWIFKEDKWEDFVKHEKDYIAQGGKYR